MKYSILIRQVNLDAGAYGLASIHSAAIEGFVEVVELLVQNGEKLELQDGLGNPRLFCAHAEAGLRWIMRLRKIKLR